MWYIKAAEEGKIDPFKNDQTCLNHLLTKVTWIHIDESKFNNNDGWAKQFIFYFLIILIKQI